GRWPARGPRGSLRARGRSSVERRLAAARALPDHPGPAGAGRRLPRRRPRVGEGGLEGALSRSQPPAPHSRGALPAGGARPRAARRERLGSNLSLSYRRPLKIVRGWRQHLYDDTGRAFLDFYNNVPLVGHSHPRVVRAAQEQLALLNTNTRYLHENVVRYAE